MASFFMLYVTSIFLAYLFYYFFYSKSKAGSNLRLPPGPKGLPVIGNLLQLGPKPHLTLHAMSHTYGPLMLVRFGVRDVIVVTSSAMAAIMFKTHDAIFADRPFTITAKYIGNNGKDMVSAPYGPRTRMLRKLCLQNLLSPRSISEFKLITMDEVSNMVRRLAEAGNNFLPVEIHRWLYVCNANNLTRIALGRRLFAEATSDNDNNKKGDFKETVEELFRLGGAFVIGDYIPAMKWIDFGGIVAGLKEVTGKYEEFIGKIIDEHLSSTSKSIYERIDVLSRLMELKNNVDGEGGKLSLDDIKAIIWNMFLGGTDTAPNTVECLMSELMRRRDILQKAQEELDSVVGHGRLVAESDLQNLHILRAIIKETLRLHPPVPLSIPRITYEECRVSNYRIPKNAMLFFNIWAIGRDPDVWTDPSEFKPERFLPGGENQHIDVKGNHFELIPFGAGRRMCVGYNFGLHMILFMAASLIHAFEWELPEGVAAEELNMEETFGLTVRRAEPLTLRLSRRLAPHVYA